MRLLIPLFLGLPALVSAQEAGGECPFQHLEGGSGDWEVLLQADFESRYVSEGRDNLDGDSLLTGTLEASWKALTLGCWYAESPQQSYNELQLFAGLGWERDDWEWYVGYTHLRFPDDGGHDHETGAGIAWSGIPGDLTVSLDGYYSFAEQGGFFDTALSREWQVLECLTLTPAVVFGANAGYIADGHDGANHLDLRLLGEWAVSEHATVSAHISYNFALDRDAARDPGDALLRDFFHAGVGVGWRF